MAKIPDPRVKANNHGKETLVTEFAPPERSEKDEIRRQKRLFANSPQFKQFADFIPDPILVLNHNRQIVFANITALKVIKASGWKNPYGLRPGEALRCEHASDCEWGCGTSSFCRHCGAVRAILSSLKGAEDVQECRLSRDGTREAFLFLVFTYPLQMDSDTFSFFILKDVTKERRMHILERVFFHDIKNTLTALNGWVSLLKGATDPDQTREVGRVIDQLSSELVDEVQAQEQFIEAESNQLVPHISTINSLALLEEIREEYQGHEVATNRDIIIDPNADKVQFRSDASLLKRVLSNITRNALEAIQECEAVTLGCTSMDNQVQFWVHNPGLMPEEVQSQIFKWSFSTKSKDRGLGTYSMRLLSERYLGGKVSFTSTHAEGTKFVASYPLSLG